MSPPARRRHEEDDQIEQQGNAPSQFLEQLVLYKQRLKNAAELMEVTYPQGKRLNKRYQKRGLAGPANDRRGTPARYTLCREIRNKIVALRQDKYKDINDTHFTEMLQELERLTDCRQTVLRILHQPNISPRRTGKPPPNTDLVARAGRSPAS